MARIRVNTEDLKTKAKDFESAGEAISRAGDEILAAAMAMPSYDGQLSGPARKAGYAIQTQAKALGAALAGDAESLRKAARDFENVDNQAIDLFEENTALMSDSPIYDGPGGEGDAPIRQGGTPELLIFGFLAYKDYGDYVIFWRNGQTITIEITDENRSLISQYEDYLDEFFKNFADLLNTYNYLVQQGISAEKIFWVFILLVSLDLFTAGLLDKLGVALGIGLVAPAIVKSAADKATEMAGMSPLDIIKECGKILDPVNPEKWLPELTNLLQYGQGACQALDNANEVWNILVPPPALPESPYVRVPTPPTPTPTPTPTP
ncbi:MAG: hypothetical protein JW748_00925 [Anaerolineales bacterium]|nr:hypothetical protein [Anaerolineales bacterium]